MRDGGCSCWYCLLYVKKLGLREIIFFLWFLRYEIVEEFVWFYLSCYVVYVDIVFDVWICLF